MVVNKGLHAEAPFQIGQLSREAGGPLKVRGFYLGQLR